MYSRISYFAAPASQNGGNGLSVLGVWNNLSAGASQQLPCDSCCTRSLSCSSVSRQIVFWSWTRRSRPKRALAPFLPEAVADAGVSVGIMPWQRVYTRPLGLRATIVAELRCIRNTEAGSSIVRCC